MAITFDRDATDAELGRLPHDVRTVFTNYYAARRELADSQLHLDAVSEEDRLLIREANSVSEASTKLIRQFIEAPNTLVPEELRETSARARCLLEEQQRIRGRFDAALRRSREALRVFSDSGLAVGRLLMRVA